MTDKLATTPKLNLGFKKVGFSATRSLVAEQLKTIDPLTVKNRIAIEMDDSGSMGEAGMKEAHNAINAFLSVCSPLDTSVSIIPMNKEGASLTCDYGALRAFAVNIRATGGTPLYSTAMKCLSQDITRVIIFSDGEPTDGAASRYDYSKNEYVTDPQKPHEKLIASAVEKKIPLDTVYIGVGESSVLKELSDKTGGIYLRFSGPEVFARSLKYLAPTYRAMLMNSEIKEKVQRGEVI